MQTERSEPSLPDEDTVIHRCIDDRKFADLFKTFDEHERWKPLPAGTTLLERIQPPGRLWFSYPLFFGDSYEATFPDINNDPDRYYEAVLAHKNLCPEVAARFRDKYLKTDNKVIREGIRFMANLCGASSWEAHPSKEPTLWRRIQGDGVAIRSTCGKVRESLQTAQGAQREARVSYCAVGYIDHTTHFTVNDGYRDLLALIQRAHSYEHEVRFVAKSPALASINMNPTVMPGQSHTPEFIIEQSRPVVAQLDATYEAMKKSFAEGFRLPVDLASLITEVVVKPKSSPAYETKVRERLAEFGCTHVPVRRA